VAAAGLSIAANQSVVASVRTALSASDLIPPPFRLAGDPVSPPPAAIVEAAANGTPEARLISIYRLIADYQLDAALDAATALTDDIPTFKLAQLVKADLLSAKAGAIGGFGGTADTPFAADPDAEHAIADMRAEARLRIQALQFRPPPDAVPAEFVQLPPSARYAIAVDTAHARLYLFQNTEFGPRLLSDYYISVGKQGVDKLVEGDQRTPLGVYFITDRIGKAQLDDRFGIAAMPLNYPNAFDKWRGRTGSGILLHGVSASTYSRPPLDSDGCVSLSNADLEHLLGQLPQRGTPVVITRELHWVQPDQMHLQTASRDAFMGVWKQWEDARVRGDEPAMRSLYDAAPPSLAATEALDRRLGTAVRAVDDLSLLTWKDDQRETMVVTFTEEPESSRRRARVVRQYWARETSEQPWAIVAEGTVR